LRRWTPVSKTDNGASVIARFDFSDVERVKRAITDLDRTLDNLMDDKLPPHMVEEILGISSAERNRWIKDGRLPKSGMGSFKKGSQQIFFYMHRFREIALLVAHPEIIAKWRESDAQAAQNWYSAV